MKRIGQLEMLRRRIFIQAIFWQSFKSKKHVSLIVLSYPDKKFIESKENRALLALFLNTTNLLAICR